MAVPTAAVLVIGNEILSGRTQDANIRFIAARLTERGVRLMEVRIVPDTESAIIDAVRDLKEKHDCLFTTGGIGPTHDDITAEAVARAFDVALRIDPEARAMLQAYCESRGVPLNEGRLRMARIPEGATLIANGVSAAPGFSLDNVHVLAGVPNIMQDMFLSLESRLPSGPVAATVTLACDLREGDIAFALEEIQRRYPDVEIGSYPSMAAGAPRLSLVLRGLETARVRSAADETAALLQRYGGAPTEQ